MSFGQQFLAGQKFAQGLVETYRDAQQRRELAAIADAKPVEEGELAAPQVQQIEAAAADGTKHIGYDTSTKAYMATPKLGENEMGPAQPVEIARQKTMTEFLGKKTPGTMTPEQVTGARQVAMAEVISKSDPIQGMRLQREMKQGEREDKRWMREDKAATEDDDFKKAQQTEFGQTIYGKRMGDYATQVQAYDQYQAQLKGGAAPETLGAPPPMPQRPAYSAGESLADSGRLLANKAKFGKADPAELMQFAERFQKVADEGYGKALKMAQSGAPLDKVIEQFNQTGSMKLDASAVVSDEMVKGADGVPARVITVRDANGKTQTINALSELDAIGQAESYISRFNANRAYDLNERKTAVAEKNAGTNERKLDVMMAGILARNSGGGGRGGGGQLNGPALKDRRDYLSDFSGSLPDPKGAMTPKEAQDISNANQKTLSQADAIFSTNAELGIILTAPQASAAMRIASQDPTKVQRIRDNNTGVVYETVNVNGKSIVLGVGSLKPAAPAAPATSSTTAKTVTGSPSPAPPVRAPDAPQPVPTTRDKILSAMNPGGNASMESVLGPKAAQIQGMAEMLRQAKVKTADAAKTGDPQIVMAAAKEQQQIRSLIEQAAKDMNSQQAAAVRRAAGIN